MNTYSRVPNVYTKPWTPEYTYTCPVKRDTSVPSYTIKRDMLEERERDRLEALESHVPYSWREEYG